MSEDGTISEQGGSADMSRRKWRAPSSGAGSINLSLEEPTNGLLYEDELLWGDDPNKHYFEYIMNKHERNSSEGASSGNLGQAVFAPPLLIDNATPLDASSAHPTPAPADPATGSSHPRQTRKDAEQLKNDPSPLAIDTNNGEPDGLLRVRQADIPSVIYVENSAQKIIPNGDAASTFSNPRLQPVCRSKRNLIIMLLIVGTLGIVTSVAMILAKQLPSKGSQQQAVDPTSSISASVASGSESPSSIPAVLPSESPSIPAVLPPESPSIPAVLPPESPSIPAVLPSESPSIVASWQPSAVESKGPSESPTEEPTVQPATPTRDPTPTPNNTTAAPSLPKTASPTAKDDTSVPSSSPSTDMPFIATPNETTSPTVTNNTVMPPSSPPTDMPFNASPSETTSPTTTTPSAPVALTDDTVGLQTPLPSQQETVTAPSASLGPEAFGTPSPTQRDTVITPSPSPAPMTFDTPPPSQEDTVLTPSPSEAPMKLESPSPSQRETVKTLSPSVAPVIHETPSPTDFPSEMPLSTPAPSEAGDATSGIDPTLVSLFVDLSTHDDGAALKSSSTPQNDALHWLAQDPSLDSYSDEQKVQRFVLATLFYSTDGPDWVNSDGWISDINECTWFSYTELCDGSGNLLQVDLRENSLLGTLPVELSWLESLEKLNLKDNSLYGQIPREFGEFKSLAYLQFARNDLTGTLPTELARVTNLETIGLSGNALEGEIPTQYAALTLLARLRLDENNFSGNIPTEFGSMTSLELVDLFGNSLKGTIPTELGGLPRLANLTVSDNSLSGTMPDELCSQADAIYIAADCDEVDCPCCSEC